MYTPQFTQGWGSGTSNGYRGANPYPLSGGLQSMLYGQNQHNSQMFEWAQRMAEQQRAAQAEAERQKMLTNEQNRQSQADFYGNQAKDLELGNLRGQASLNSFKNANTMNLSDLLMRELTNPTKPGYTPDPLLEKQHQAAIAAANAQKNQMSEQLATNVFGTGQEGTTMAGDKARQLGLNDAANYAGIEGDFAKLMMEDKYRQMELNNPMQKFGMLSQILGGMGGGQGLDISSLLGGMGMGSSGLQGLLGPVGAPRYPGPVPGAGVGPSLGANMGMPEVKPVRQEVSDQFAGGGGGFNQGGGSQQLISQLSNANLSPEQIQQILQQLQGGGR